MKMSAAPMHRANFNRGRAAANLSYPGGVQDFFAPHDPFIEAKITR